MQEQEVAVATEPVVDDSGAAGEVEVATEQPSVEPPREVLDITEIGDKFVTVKVDGEELQVPLSEALSGYSRTEDYTRKTQSLAQQRQETEDAIRLSQAFQADPALTVRVLAQQAGMSVEQFVGLSGAQQQQAIQDNSAADDFADPLEQRLARMESEFAQREADAKLASHVQRLQAETGINEEMTRQVVIRALNMNLGPEHLLDVYKMVAFEGTVAAQQQLSQQQAEEDQRRQAAASRAAASVSSGAGSAASVSPVVSEVGMMSAAEAAEAAWNQLYG